MGRREGNGVLWAICEGCGHHGNVTRVPHGQMVCRICGCRRYTLTGNDPSKPPPVRAEAGPAPARLTLEPSPDVDAEEAIRLGRYP